MSKNESKPKSQKKPSTHARNPDAAFMAPPRPLPPPPHPADSEIPAVEAFLEEAKKEPKRKLITDHMDTITVLRNEKRFTFRAIADWLTARGIEADHSAVYRAYLAAVPEEKRDPREDWSDVDMPE